MRTVRSDAAAVVLSLEGTFDAPEARRVHDALSTLPEDARVSLDFREVRAFDDSAMALLARDLLAARSGRVRAAGLSHHQRRLLKYLGVDEAHLGEPSIAEAEAARAFRDGDHLGI
ncbi:MAG TPA: STAS domain-containing protein [Anaeromyxobacteraceae bacterium]|nr:STAS domain-containing protein [Anaeromyxobacteraceae bacterium]